MARRRTSYRSMSNIPGLPRTSGMRGLPPGLRIAVTILVVLVGLLATYLKSRDAHPASNDNAGSPPPLATTAPAGSGIVTHVADGDTIDVDFDGDGPQQPIKVRLLGIDCPEVHGPTAALGNTAKAYTVARVEQKSVTLAYDGTKAKLDKYGRTLAYVYLADGTLLNESLVRDGEAFAHRTLTCGRTATLIHAEDEARAANRGFWPSMTNELMPEWRQKWMAEGSPALR